MDKSIIRISKKENPYVMIDKTCLQDERLSWKAKGLLCYLLSLPDDWKIYIDELKNHASDGRDGTATALRELITFGYCIRERARDEKGKFIGYVYTVYENPVNKPNIKPEHEQNKGVHPKTENPYTENPKLLNNNNTNKLYKLNNNNSNNKTNDNKNNKLNEINNLINNTHINKECVCQEKKKTAENRYENKNDNDIKSSSIVKVERLLKEYKISNSVISSIMKEVKTEEKAYSLIKLLESEYFKKNINYKSAFLRKAQKEGYLYDFTEEIREDKHSKSTLPIFEHIQRPVETYTQLEELFKKKVRGELTENDIQNILNNLNSLQ